MGKNSVTDVPLVKEFLDVFLDELHSVPPARKVEFWNNLILILAPIAKASYHLAPPKIQGVVLPTLRAVGQAVYQIDQFHLGSINSVCEEEEWVSLYVHK